MTASIDVARAVLLAGAVREGGLDTAEALEAARRADLAVRRLVVSMPRRYGHGDYLSRVAAFNEPRRRAEQAVRVWREVGSPRVRPVDKTPCRRVLQPWPDTPPTGTG